ncbi:hypothetical protein OH77DRAFT_1553508 [Trametes cingulata]|nr:hypothetical protein OH77DRAFT_1553508 [Trametes cingulata]
MASRDRSSEASSSKWQACSPSPSPDNSFASCQQPSHLSTSTLADAMASSSTSGASASGASAWTFPSHAIPSRAIPSGGMFYPNNYSFNLYDPASPFVYTDHRVDNLSLSHTDLAHSLWEGYGHPQGSGQILGAHVIELYPGSGTWQPPTFNDNTPMTIDPSLLFGPPPSISDTRPAPRPSTPPASSERAKENQPTPGPSAGASQNVPRRKEKKRSCEYDNAAADSAMESKAGASSDPRKRRTKKARIDKPGPSSSKGTTASTRKDPKQPIGRPRRKKAELEERTTQTEAQCGQGECATMLSSSADTYSHLKQHYPGKGPYQCSYDTAPGKKCNMGPYSDLQGLQRHIEHTHFGWRGFACGKCGKQFGRRDVMKTHEKSCTGAAKPKQK